MTKGTQTALLVLGGAAVLGAGGYAIYRATKKDDAQTGGGGGDIRSSKPAVNVSTTPDQLAQIANAVNTATRNLQTAAATLAQTVSDLGQASPAL